MAPALPYMWRTNRDCICAPSPNSFPLQIPLHRDSQGTSQHFMQVPVSFKGRVRHITSMLGSKHSYSGRLVPIPAVLGGGLLCFHSIVESKHLPVVLLNHTPLILDKDPPGRTPLLGLYPQPSWKQEQHGGKNPAPFTVRTSNHPPTTMPVLRVGVFPVPSGC